MDRCSRVYYSWRTFEMSFAGSCNLIQFATGQIKMVTETKVINVDAD